MDRRVGIPPTTAQEQLQRSTDLATGASYSHAGVQPLPDPLNKAPFRVKASDLGIKDSGSLRFFVIGDHGGIKDPVAANAVSNAMQAASGPAFVYSVGDVVYFNGDAAEYAPQFYEQYAHLNVPILAIPGNHDGDTTDDASRAPLDTFMSNFCSPEPALPDADPQGEHGRDTQTQPYCYWTLESEAVTIIGLYSNVPSGGHIDQNQIDWLAGELKDAPTDRPCIVAVHHPPYSIDAHHGGSKKIGDAIDQAASRVGRGPDMVLSGHVHDYQRFTRRGLHSGSTDAAKASKTVPYIVIGNSGYHNLHKLAPGAAPGQDMGTGVTFEAGDDSNWGFLELVVSGAGIKGTYHGVQKDGSAARTKDTF